MTTTRKPRAKAKPITDAAPVQAAIADDTITVTFALRARHRLWLERYAAQNNVTVAAVVGRAVIDAYSADVTKAGTRNFGADSGTVPRDQLAAAKGITG